MTIPPHSLQALSLVRSSLILAKNHEYSHTSAGLSCSDRLGGGIEVLRILDGSRGFSRIFGQ